MNILVDGHGDRRIKKPHPELCFCIAGCSHQVGQSAGLFEEPRRVDEYVVVEGFQLGGLLVRLTPQVERPGSTIAGVADECEPPRFWFGVLRLNGHALSYFARTNFHIWTRTNGANLSQLAQETVIIHQESVPCKG